MARELRRCWLILAFGRAACRCARALRRCLPPRRIAVVALRPGPDGQQRVYVKGFARRAWRGVAADEIDAELMERLAAAAASVRNQRGLVQEFAGPIGSVQLDVAALVDSTDPRAARVCQSVMSRIAAEAVLHNLPAPGLRLLALVPGARQRRLPDETAELLGRHGEGGNALTDHTIVFHPSNMDGCGLDPPDLAETAGRTLGCLLGFPSGNFVRALLGPPTDDVEPRMRFWAAGLATTAWTAPAFIRQALHHYDRFLQRTWLARTWKPGRARQQARRMLSVWIDSSIPATALPWHLARWAAGFFPGWPVGEGPAAPTPADLQACLGEMVNELAVLSQHLGANLPNIRLYAQRPRDPRGWFKRLVNWCSFDRLFRWEPRWEPPPDHAAHDAARRARLASLDHVLMNSQTAVEMALAALRETAGQQPIASREANPWPRDWAATLIRKLTGRPEVAKLVAKALLAGVSPLKVFRGRLVRCLNIPAAARGPALIQAIASALDRDSDCLREVLRGLAEQAAPWWDDAVDPRAEQHQFICVPQAQLDASAEAVDVGWRAVPWHREAYAALTLLQGCVPTELASRLARRQRAPRPLPRAWIAAGSPADGDGHNR